MQEDAMEKTHRVLVMRCDRYDAARIAGIVKEGMQELGVRPAGRIMLKPNVVMAHPEIFPHAFTRAEFLDGVLAATKEMAEGAQDITVGERSGITIPTRYNFQNAGYPEVLRKHGVKACYFDEARHVPVEIKSAYSLRDKLYIPQPLVNCDFLINLPKFKAHPWCRLTLSLKNFIGIQDDRHRLVDHNQFLEHKIADLQAVIQPRFIAIDGITAGQKMMLTPTPFDLGAIVMGTNSCAVDTVGCHMVHVDPNDLIHLRFASQRGFGPMDLGQIEVGGDFPLEEVREKTRNFQFCLERIDDYFGESSNLTCTVGTFPEEHSREYCWGGCPGSLQEAMHIFRGFTPDVDKTMRPVRYVVGKVDGPLDLKEGERAIFVGDCTSWEGRIDGRSVRIEGCYRSAKEVDEDRTQTNDMLLKVGKAMAHTTAKRFSRWIQLKGCPVSVAQHVNYLSAMGGIGNPVLDPRLSVPNTVAYTGMRVNRLLNRFR
jgi:uncharacterized protein (DUF362 family)